LEAVRRWSEIKRCEAATRYFVLRLRRENAGQKYFYFSFKE